MLEIHSIATVGLLPFLYYFKFYNEGKSAHFPFIVLLVIKSHFRS